MSEEKLTLHYFAVKARAFGAVVGAAYWKKNLVWEKYSFQEWGNDKGGVKAKCAFGQMPILEDGDDIIPQSNGIVRYLGRKWGKEGSTMQIYALSETLIEESIDVFQVLADAKYKGGTESKKDSPEAWDEALGKLGKHWTNLEKLMTGYTFGNETTMGDMSLFASVNIAVDSDPGTLNSHQNLKAWYDGIANNSAVKALLESEDYLRYVKKPTTPEEQKEEGPMVFHYFGIKARGFAVPVAAAYLNKTETEFRWAKYSFEDWGANKDDIKSKCAFGQLPVLEDGNVTMSQSMAIARYVAKKWQLDGANMKEYGRSQALIEESNDLLKILIKAKKGKTSEAMTQAFESLPKHFGNIQKFMDKGKFATQPIMGEMCIFHVINILKDCEPTCLDAFSTLKAWYEAFLANDGVSNLVATTAKYYQKQ